MASGDLTTLANVRAWLQTPATDTSNDALVGSLITAASTYVSSWLNRDLLSASYSERYKGNGRETIMLANGPVSAVAAVNWQGTSITTAGDPIAGTPGFYFDDQALSLYGYCFPRGCLVQVQYTAGFASVPLDIQQAVNELVGEAFARKDRIGLNSKTLGGQETISFSSKDMNDNIKTLLMQYRAVVPVQTF